MADEYLAKFIGNMPILMHANDLEAQAETKAWLEGAGKDFSFPGDDRCPVWTWMSWLYYSPAGLLAVPQHCIMAALRIGGSKVKNGASNWAKPSQFGIGLKEDWYPLSVDGKTIAMEPILRLKKRDYTLHPGEFARHRADAEKLGLTLQVVPVVNPSTKKRNIRVRPRLDRWSFECTITVLFPGITRDILQKILDASGLYGGLFDWSPHSRKPGPHGTYTVELRESRTDKKSA